MSLPTILDWLGCAPLVLGFVTLGGGLDSGPPEQCALGVFLMVVGGLVCAWGQRLRDLERGKK